MSTTQKQATVARNIMFRSAGLNYSTFLHASTGDLIQQYDDDGNYYPEITPTDPIRVQFTATSSKSQGVVIPDTITYKIGGVALTFDTSGKCTAPAAATGIFRRDGTDLLVVGNIADYLGKVSSMLEAVATKGDDSLYACCPVDISKRVSSLTAKVSIAPGDDKNFTLTSQNDSVRLKAGVLTKAGWVYDSPKYKYLWEIVDPDAASGWSVLALGSGSAGGSVTVPADMVNTYANIRVTVYNAGIQDSVILGTGPVQAMPVGSDCVGILDASDPLDIVCVVKINKTGSGSEVDADDESLDDSMPATAYLIYTPTLVVRGQNTSAGSTTWLTGILVDPAGVTTRNIIPSSGRYKVMVSDLSSSYGQHTLVMTGKLN